MNSPHKVADNSRKTPPYYSDEFKQRLVAGITDMRNSFQGLAAKIESTLQESPFSGHLFVFRGKRGHLLKILWSTGDGLCLLSKRLEQGRFAWPQARDGKVYLTAAQTLLFSLIGLVKLLTSR